LQFAGFLVVGASAAAVNWLARVAFSWWVAFGWAVVAAYAVGMTVAFILNSRYVFPRSRRPKAQQARDFILVNAMAFPIVWGASIGIEYLLRAAGMVQYTEELAHGLAVALPAVLSFLLYKFVAFRDFEPIDWRR
jgi:putative flippase GtrA